MLSDAEMSGPGLCIIKQYCLDFLEENSQLKNIYIHIYTCLYPVYVFVSVYMCVYICIYHAPVIGEFESSG